MLHYLLASAILLAPEATASRAQEAAPSQAVIRAETRLVLVDAIITDKSGNPVRDLSAKDFRVWEDGKEQTVTSASLEQKSSAGPKRDYLVFYIDNYTLDSTSQPQVKEGLVKFFNQEGAQERLTAIAEFNGSMRILQNFTSDPVRLQRTIERLGPPSGRSALDAGGGSLFGTDPRGGMRATRPGALRSAPTAAEHDAEAELLALGDLARSVASVPGRKTIVLISGGFPQARMEKVEAAIAALNEANAAVYSINARGLDTTSMSDPTLLLSRISKATGGFMVAGSNDILPGLQKIAAEEAAHYLIGYRPAEPAGGRCHPLRVEVQRDDVNVRARSRYCDFGPDDVLAGTQAGKDLEALVEGAPGAAAGAIAASAQAPFFHSLPNVARVNLALDLRPGAVRVSKVKGKLQASVNVLAAAYEAGGEVAARFSDTAVVNFKNQKEADEFLKKPFHYDKQFRVAAGNYTLKVAFSQQDGSSGRLELPLSIEPFDGKQFGMSAIALSKEYRELPADAKLDLMLLGDRGPLALNNIQFIPAGGNRFTANDEAHVYAEVYEPLLLTGNAPAVSTRLVITDKKTGQQRRSQPLNVTAQARPGTNVIPVAMRLPLQALPPGSYRAELQAAGGEGKTASRWVDFEVQ